MKNRRPKFPWKVVLLTSDGPLPEVKFTSEAKAYLAVNLQREMVREGSSAVTRALVYEWDRAGARWQTFEKHNLVAEAEAMPRNEALGAQPEIPDEVEVPSDETGPAPKRSRVTAGGKTSGAKS